MGAMTATHEDEPPRETRPGTPVVSPPPSALTPVDRAAPTGRLVAGTMGERCVTCSAPLASDQRYCVHCGARRGKARFSFASLAAAPVAVAPAPESRPPRARRASSGATFVAGIGTLLLALGVGVLIGHNGNGNSSQRAPAAQVITVNGGGAAPAAATAGATTSTPTASSSTSKSGSKSAKAKTKAAPTKVVVQKAAQAANKVLGGGANLPPPTTKVGSKGSGPGFQNGKFTGGFFGGP
jgi:hypothetical protein